MKPGDNNTPASPAQKSAKTHLSTEEMLQIQEGKNPQQVKQNRQGRRKSIVQNKKLMAWWDHHIQSAFDSLQRIMLTPVSSFLTWMAIGIALALPSILFIILNNVETIGTRWDNGTRVSLYLQAGIDDEQGQILAERIAQRSDIAKAEYISREDALSFFKHHSGLREALHNLDENPFPASIEIQYTETLSPTEVTRLLDKLQKLKGIESVQLDMEWVQRLYQMMQLGKRLTLVLICLLTLGVLLVVGNTIRLAIENRRDEIVIVKLVGGADSFVRRPFLYSGFWYGLGGGLIALLIIITTLWFLRDTVGALIDSYDTDFSLLSMQFTDSIGLLLCGIVLGWLGAWLAVSHHLVQIEP